MNFELQSRGVILLIEDNPDIMKINRTALAKRGFRTLESETLAQGCALLESEAPDLIVLDIMLPDGSGLDFLRKLRAGSGSPSSKNIPVLFLTALGGNQDILNGFEAGGDDYLPKPYDPKVLAARAEALLRRAGQKPQPLIVKGALMMNTVSQRVTVKGEDIALTPKEFAILLYLARHEEGEVQAEHLYEAAWGRPMNKDANAVRVAVSRLRKKLEPSGLEIIISRGSGYRLCY